MVIQVPLLRPAQDDASLRISSVASLHAVPETDLVRMTNGRTFYMSRPWLLALEERRSSPSEYILIYDGEEILRGICPVYWGDRSTRGFYDPFGHFLRSSGGHFCPTDWAPAYLIGSRAAYSGEFLIDPGASEVLRRRVLTMMLDTAAALAAKTGCASLSALYLNEAGAVQLSQVLTEAAALYIADVNSVIDVNWKSFDEYRASLGRKGAAVVRRERRVFAEQGYTLHEGRLSDWIDPAANLFANLERRYGHDDSPAAETAELELLCRHADQYSHVRLYSTGERPVAAVLTFIWGGVVYVRSIGFDYTLTRNAYEYFNLAFYDSIDMALEHGCHRIDLGPSTYQAKLLRGARLEPLLGMTLSSTAGLPGSDPKFAARDAARRHAIEARDSQLLKGCGLE